MATTKTVSDEDLLIRLAVDPDRREDVVPGFRCPLGALLG
jgi:hypothetical protein